MHCGGGGALQRDAWLGACMAGGMCGGGPCVMGGGMHCRGHAWQGVLGTHTHPWQILRNMVHERTLCILLECILVLVEFL